MGAGSAAEVRRPLPGLSLPCGRPVSPIRLRRSRAGALDDGGAAPDNSRHSGLVSVTFHTAIGAPGVGMTAWVCSRGAPLRRLRLVVGLGLWFFLQLGVPAALEFGLSFSSRFPGVAGAGQPRLVPGVTGFEARPLSGQLRSEGLGAGLTGFVLLDFGVCGLLQGVGVGLCGKPHGAAHVRRSAGLGTFPGEDPGFQLAAVHAAQDSGFVAYLHGSKYCITHGFERCRRRGVLLFDADEEGEPWEKYAAQTRVRVSQRANMRRQHGR